VFETEHELRAAVTFSSQGQRSMSNMPTFIWLVEPTQIYDLVKFHQNLTDSFHVVMIIIIFVYYSCSQTATATSTEPTSCHSGQH